MACRQGYLEFASPDDRVLVEHLVEIAEPEEQYSSRIAFLYLKVLPKHRRGIFHRQRSGIRNPSVAKPQRLSKLLVFNALLLLVNLELLETIHWETAL